MLEQWGFAEEYSVVVKHAYDQVALMHSHLLGGSKIDGPALFDLRIFKRLGLDKANLLSVYRY